MKTLVPVIGLLLLAGCATTQPPKAEWRLVDGAWVGPTTTMQNRSWRDRIPCNTIADPSIGCRLLGAANEAWLNVQPAIEAIGKMK